MFLAVSHWPLAISFFILKDIRGVEGYPTAFNLHPTGPTILYIGAIFLRCAVAECAAY